jgi:hypothetical protein
MSFQDAINAVWAGSCFGAKIGAHLRTRKEARQAQELQERQDRMLSRLMQVSLSLLLAIGMFVLIRPRIA